LRDKLSANIEKYRVKTGPMASDESFGMNGVFILQHADTSLSVVVSDGMEWDHVSVSTRTRCPTWDEMCWVKNIFFDPEETVIQYHPPESCYIDEFPYALHMWRKQGATIELPPAWMVGRVLK